MPDESRIWHHRLTPGLVAVLIEAVNYVHQANRNEFHLRDLHLSNSAYCNAQKLHYFALIAKTEKRGYWLITNHGGAFLRNELSVPDWVETLDNHIVAKSEKRVYISHFRGKIPEFQSEFFSEPAKVEEPMTPALF
jgi:hypothetical protein